MSALIYKTYEHCNITILQYVYIISHIMLLPLFCTLVYYNDSIFHFSFFCVNTTTTSQSVSWNEAHNII